MRVRVCARGGGNSCLLSRPCFVEPTFMASTFLPLVVLVQGQSVAVKVIDKRRVRTPKQQTILQREIDIMKRLQHPNIVMLLDSFETKDEYCLVMEVRDSESMCVCVCKVGGERERERVCVNTHPHTHAHACNCVLCSAAAAAAAALRCRGSAAVHRKARAAQGSDCSKHCHPAQGRV